MKKQKYVIIISGIAIILFSYFSMKFLGSMKKQPQKKDDGEIVKFVKAVPVKYGKLKGEIISSGRVYSKSEITLSSEVAGKILQGNISFKKGQNFKKGDLLLKIYAKEAGLSLKASKSNFLNLLAGLLPDLKIDFKDSYKNWYKFFENIDIEKDLPELPEITSTKEKVFLSSRNILSSYYNIKSAESNYRKHFIFAPFNGAITDVMVEVGGFAGMGTRLGNIINTKELELEVPLKIEDAKWVNVGDKVKIFNEKNSESWDGTVIRKSGDLDIQTQSISVFVQILNNQKSKLYKGQYLIAHFYTLLIKDVMEIPRNSIINTSEVYVVRNNILQKEKINVIRLNEKTAYINGLNSGEMLVVEPLANAKVNTKVKIIKKEK